MSDDGPDIFANRYPADRPDKVPRCSLEWIAGRWRTIAPGRRHLRTARGLHIFVVQGRRLFIAKVRFVPGRVGPVGHIDLAAGRDVEFAGEIAFGSSRGNRGMIKFWNDRSGHYFDRDRPMDPSAVAWLPRDLFEPMRGR